MWQLSELYFIPTISTTPDTTFCSYIISIMTFGFILSSIKLAVDIKMSTWSNFVKSINLGTIGYFPALNMWQGRFIYDPFMPFCNIQNQHWHQLTRMMSKLSSFKDFSTKGQFAGTSKFQHVHHYSTQLAWALGFHMWISHAARQLCYASSLN